LVPTIFAVIGIAFFLTGVAVYLWPHPKMRFERIFVATFGALLGSLIGRVAVDPGWPGHLLFVAAGAFMLCVVDRFRSKSVSRP
jgi:hypothetical protein